MSERRYILQSRDTQEVIESGELLDQSTESFIAIELKLSPMRWLILLFYLLCALAGAAISITFTPVSLLIVDAYSVPLIQVNLCTLCFGITAVPMFLTSMRMYTWISTATTLRIGAVLLIIGCWTR